MSDIAITPYVCKPQAMTIVSAAVSVTSADRALIARGGNGRSLLLKITNAATTTTVTLHAVQGNDVVSVMANGKTGFMYIPDTTFHTQLDGTLYLTVDNTVTIQATCFVG